MCSFLTLFIGAVIAVKSPAGNPCPTLNSVAVPSSSAVAMEAVPPVAVPAIEPMPENEYEREYLKAWEFVQRNYIFSDKRLPGASGAIAIADACRMRSKRALL